MSNYEQMLLVSGTLDTSGVGAGEHGDLTAVSTAFSGPVQLPDAVPEPLLEGALDPVENGDSEGGNPEAVEQDGPESDPEVPETVEEESEAPMAAEAEAPATPAKRTRRRGAQGEE
ncbi:hypothetical protein [Kitasatospora viridis]|uniref:Uncharacterized protein n=1 Tax=Kitasatospora viridis TaxID=281105 RepID=A0A561S9W2_9ACTN|nr:hypothetical protein [Kitasatospora viridis]TWF71661.1 hypothetical protein FHX73_1832 [Kitasatospora viridis]